MKNSLLNLILFSTLIFIFSRCTPVYVAQDTEVVQPAWAPDYDNQVGVNYYYFPDYSMYYDVRHHEYVYMEDGNWFFTPQPPIRYSSYDFNNAYVVGLDYKIHEPWMHHATYVSHYPPYYYKSYYNNNRAANENRDVRGFNENDRKPFYGRNASGPNDSRRTVEPPSNQQINTVQPTRQNERPARRSRNTVVTEPEKTPARQDNHPPVNTNNTNVRQNDMPTQHSRNTEPEKVQPRQESRNTAPQAEKQQRSQPVIYKNSNVGQPVKVTRNMMPPPNTANTPSTTKPARTTNKKDSDTQKR